MKKFFYMLFMSSYLMASPITPTSMLDNTYHCVDFSGNALQEITFVKGGNLYGGPLYDVGFSVDYKLENSLIILSGGDFNVTLVNATETSFDLTTSDGILWNSCHDNFEDALTDADNALADVLDSVIVLVPLPQTTVKNYSLKGFPL